MKTYDKNSFTEQSMLYRPANSFEDSSMKIIETRASE